MSIVLRKTIRKLWYNSTLEVINHLNSKIDEETSSVTAETKSNPESKTKFVGYNKKVKKEWDTLKNRESDLSTKGYQKPVSLSKGAMDFIINKITTKQIPKLTAEKKKLIWCHTSSEWGLVDDLKKGIKGTGINSDALICYIKYIAFIGSQIAYNSGKRFTLGKEIIATFEILDSYSE
jgi:hypothetical protein